MGSDSTVSVVVPTHYRNDSLRVAVRSVLHQEYDPLEVVVVDDSGTEHARPVVKEFADITYVPLNDNRGAQIARAVGLEHASGQYIQFLDDDDELLADKLHRQVEVFEATDGVGVVYCGLVWDDGLTVLPQRDVRGDVLTQALSFNTAPCMMGTMLVDEAVLDAVDVRKHDHGADDIGLKIELARETEFDYVDEVLFKRGDTADSLGKSKAAVDGRFKIIETYEALYADYPSEVRRQALAEAYLIKGQFRLQNQLWSASALASLAKAVYYTPDNHLSYIGALSSSLLGRPGYNVSRQLYRRLVLGSPRRGKYH
jgi:glycosyltransferase involved in cell wall biosynthesis